MGAVQGEVKTHTTKNRWRGPAMPFHAWAKRERTASNIIPHHLIR